jgi:hypothetical protein
MFLSGKLIITESWSCHLWCSESGLKPVVIVATRSDLATMRYVAQRWWVLVVFTPDHDSKPHWIYQSTVQPPHRSWAGCQAVYHHFRKKLKLLYIPEQRYSANDRRKDFMISHTKMTCAVRESNPGCPIHSPTFYELTGRLHQDNWIMSRFITRHFQMTERYFFWRAQYRIVEMSFRWTSTWMAHSGFRSLSLYL